MYRYITAEAFSFSLKLIKLINMTQNSIVKNLNYAFVTVIFSLRLSFNDAQECRA